VTEQTVTDQPEKLDLKSMDLAAEKQAELLRLFPEIRTEGGKIDFDRLKLALGETVDVGRERYGLTWPGKADCFKTIQAPSLGTLRPARDESVNFDTTENLIIEGDNLEVLKLLQKSYLGKIKMIYIDPPYNTGKDFIYPDNFGENLKTYLEYTGQVDSEGRKFGTNTETEGRFHSKWLSMMYPRLYTARNMLRDDGAIVVSIDDNESARLKFLLDEVFGEENFVSDIAVVSGANQSGEGVLVQKNYEKCFVYAKNIETLSINRIDSVNESFRNLNDAPTPLDTRTDMGYTIYYNPASGDAQAVFDYDKTKISLNTIEEVYLDKTELVENGYVAIRPGFRNKKLHRWRWGKDTFDERRSEVVFRENNGSWGAYFIQSGLNPPKNIWNFPGGSAELTEMFDGQKVFDYPKGLGLLKYILAIFAPKDSLVIDFFAGSGTLAHAVLEQNLEDGENRRFILVQLPELFASESEAKKLGFSSLFQLTRERVSRAVKKITDEVAARLDLSNVNKQDRGFRVFKLDQSNFMGWDAGASTDAEALGKQLDLSIDHVRQGRSDDDLFYELLLKSGFPLTTPVEKLNLAGKAVYSIGGGVFLICLERELTTEAIKAMADMKPSRVVCLDAGFHNNDQLKSNAVLTFKAKGVAKFQTV
jgi:adenine-specific DNA-methyltransferase